MRQTSRAAMLLMMALAPWMGGVAGAQQGFITGRVVNAQGQPVQGAEVIADNTLAYNSNLIVYSDAQGRYRIDVSVLPTTWNVTANVKLNYGGETYTIPLVPENPEVVAGRVGGVRNFTLKPKAITSRDPYGNLGIVNVQRGIGDDTDESRVTLALTPVGKLADGSTGKPLTVKPIRSGDGWIVPNVMWGTYRVTATQDGQPLEIRRKASDGSGVWGKNYTGGFVLDYYAVRPTLFVEVRRAQGAGPPGAAPSSAPASAPAPARASISGTLSADADLKGAVVFACVRRGDGCDEDTTRATTIQTSGKRVSYTVDGLSPDLAYSLIAWLDLNGDGDVNAGDLLGTYRGGPDATPVSPPLRNADITLEKAN